MSGTGIEPLFNPRGVMVVGASASPGKIGNLVVEAIKHHLFPGPVYAVNRDGGAVLGYPGFASVAAVPDPVDLAVIALPAAAVLDTIGQCIERGVKAAIVLSSGFAEVGGEGVALERAVRERAAAGGLRLLGPNCQGVMSIPDRFAPNFSPSLGGAAGSAPGPVSMVSQSGGYNSVMYKLASLNGVGFSRIVSTGNETDITAPDLFEYFAQDDQTRVVAAYLEQIRDSRRFIEVTSKLSAEKPVVISKAGRSDVGSKAAASHTGALAGAGVVGRGVLIQSGALPVRSLDEFIALLTAFSGQHTFARGNRVGILSQGGGFSVETTDLLRESGLALPPLEPQTVKALGTMIPYYGTTDNPVDFTAALMSNPAWLAETVNLLGADANVDQVAMLITSSPGGTAIDDLAAAIKACPKPVALGWFGATGTEPARLRLHELGVPSFATPLPLVTGLRALAVRGQRLLDDEFVGDLRPPKGL